MTLSRVVGEMTMEVKLPRRSARLRWGDIVRRDLSDWFQYEIGMCHCQVNGNVSGRPTIPHSEMAVNSETSVGCVASIQG